MSGRGPNISSLRLSTAYQKHLLGEVLSYQQSRDLMYVLRYRHFVESGKTPRSPVFERLIQDTERAVVAIRLSYAADRVFTGSMNELNPVKISASGSIGSGFFMPSLN